MHKNIFVVIPAYNASSTIENVLHRVTKSMLQKIEFFIIVDDGSVDNTSEVIMELSKKFNIHSVKHEVNKGYARTQKTGIKIAQGKGADIVVILYADGRYAPEWRNEKLSDTFHFDGEMLMMANITPYKHDK